MTSIRRRRGADAVITPALMNFDGGDAHWYFIIDILMRGAASR